MIDPARIQAARTVDRYLADDLSAEEVAKFEEHLLAHPEVQAEVDTVRRLKLGLAALRDKGELERLVAGKRGFGSGPLLALAATVIVAVGLGTLYFVRSPPVLAAAIDAFTPEQSAMPAVEVSLIRMRDSAAVAIELPPAGQIIALRFLVPAYSEVATFDVEIARDGAVAPLARIDGLRSDDGMSVTVYFDAHAAGSGDYRVRLQPRSSGAAPLPPEEYLLTVNPAPPP